MFVSEKNYFVFCDNTGIQLKYRFMIKNGRKNIFQEIIIDLHNVIVLIFNYNYCNK